ncbi:MAG: hypothetical protein SFZ03_06490 [Candidatus Melainabacteria bacterium]|nr:hypothetical protein [Candidatus Melainabacteria bacterium]
MVISNAKLAQYYDKPGVKNRGFLRTEEWPDERLTIPTYRELQFLSLTTDARKIAPKEPTS